ncbi:MAG: HAD hydrolase-like protein, partial [Alphaproteobacteria bacterium]
PQPYAIMAERHGIVPHRAVMLEDMSANLAPAAAMGMTTVWVRHDTDNAPDWAAPEAGCDYVHHETDDVIAWLESVAEHA